MCFISTQKYHLLPLPSKETSPIPRKSLAIGTRILTAGYTLYTRYYNDHKRYQHTRARTTTATERRVHVNNIIYIRPRVCVCIFMCVYSAGIPHGGHTSLKMKNHPVTRTECAPSPSRPSSGGGRRGFLNW